MASRTDWKIFNSIAKEALGQPNLKGKALSHAFGEIEAHLKYAIDILIDHTTFVEDNLGYLISEIALGLIKSRKIYKGKRDKTRVAVGNGHTISICNLAIFSNGFDLFKLAKLPRPEGAPKTKHILETLNLNLHVYESIIRAFINETKDYCILTERLVAIRLDLRATHPTSPECKDLEQQKEDIKEELSYIEQSVGCVNRDRLYGVSRIVEGTILTVNHVQGNIQLAYQKMVPKPARNKGINENECLDLFQAGSFGLHRAISLYDIDGNAGFPSFANSWINQKILGSAKLSGPLIKLPWSLWETHQKIRRQEQKFEADPETRYVYTDVDVAKALGKSIKTVRRVKSQVASIKLVNLDTKRRGDDGTESGSTLSQILIDQELEDANTHRANIEQIKDLLKFLTHDEQVIVCLRFGLMDHIVNNKMDQTEIVREYYRQASCKAETYLLVTGQKDDPDE